jgi:hypothetical protein
MARTPVRDDQYSEQEAQQTFHGRAQGCREYAAQTAQEHGAEGRASAIQETAQKDRLTVGYFTGSRFIRLVKKQSVSSRLRTHGFPSTGDFSRNTLPGCKMSHDPSRILRRRRKGYGVSLRL